MKEKLNEKIVTVIVVAIVAILVVSAGSFYGGMKFAGAKNAVGIMGGNFKGGPAGANMPNGKARIAAGASFINGDITAKDDKSVTIKLRDGGSKIVFFSATTEVGKFVNGSLTELAVGNSVMINGKTNTDGSVTASTIQIRPAGEIVPGDPVGVPGGQTPASSPQQQ